jgi:AraC-like DNA-binding protein
MADRRVSIRNYSDEVRSHSHAYHQIVLPQIGRLNIDVGGHSDVVENGRGVVIPAGDAHRFSTKGRNAFVVLDALGDHPALAPASSGTQRNAFFAIGPAVQRLIDYVVATAGRGHLSNAAEAAWSTLLFESIEADRCRTLDRAGIAIARALAFIRDHHGDRIGPGDIAAVAGLSESRLRALFRARLGESPHAALARIRLEEAKRLLTSTDLPIADIALRTRYADQSALTRRLRSAFGTTPSAFRRANRVLPPIESD